MCVCVLIMASLFLFSSNETGGGGKLVVDSCVYCCWESVSISSDSVGVQRDTTTTTTTTGNDDGENVDVLLLLLLLLLLHQVEALIESTLHTLAG